MLLAFENWWDEQSKQQTKGPVTKVNSLGSAASVVQQPVQPVTQTSDQQPQAAAAAKKVGFGLGLGLRASMPKLSSFRVCNQHNIAILFAYTP
jgi:hypothetical protein